MNNRSKNHVCTFMEKFNIRGKGTLHNIYCNETKPLGDTIADTDKKKKKKLEILERYHGQIKLQPEYTNEDEEMYQNIVGELREQIDMAYREQ